MKTRRIWIVIAVILIGGVCSTMYTRHYVEELELEASMRAMTEAEYEAGEAEAAAGTVAPLPFAVAETPSDAKGRAGMQKDGADGGHLPGEAAPAEGIKAEAIARATEAEAEAFEGLMGPEEAGVPFGDDMAPAADAPAAANAPLDEAEAAGMAPGSASAPVPTPRNAPAEAAQKSAGPGVAGLPETLAETRSSVVVAGGGKGSAAVSYLNRLEELDVQIERNRASDAEKSIGYSVKARAENEQKLWEAELEGIMNALEEQLDSEQVENLYAAQREWQKDKESKALDASKKQGQSSLAEVEYSISLAESTRARAYELVEEYGAVLGD